MPLLDEIAPTINPPGNGIVNNPNPQANGAQSPAVPPAVAPPVTTTSIPGYTAAQAGSTGYTPTPYAVPDNGLVQEQVRKIVGDDSKLMQQSRALANENMASRGLTNSSLNTTAGQSAVIAAALPIAQADAGAYNAAATNTANQQNAASQFAAGASNTASLANQSAVNTAFQAALNSATQLTNTRMGNETQIALANLDTATKTSLANIDVQNKQLLQASQGASNAYVQAITNIANISLSNTMSKEAKDAATASQLAMLNEQLKTIAGIHSTQAAAVYDLDLSQYFLPGSDVPPTTPTPPPAAAPATDTGNGEHIGPDSEGNMVVLDRNGNFVRFVGQG